MSLCPICPSRVLDHYPGYKRLRLLRCRACGLVFQPDPAPVSYDDGYYEHWLHGRPFEDIWSMKVTTFKAYLEFLKKRFPHTLLPGARLLDVGCAHGFMLQAASEMGLEPYGIDISAAIEYAAARGYKVQRSNLREAGFPTGFFDIVTMIDVIEHIVDPVAMVRELGRVIRPMGLLLLMTPNVSGAPAQLLGSLWPHWKAEHVHYYSVRSLARLFEAAAFRIRLARRGFKYLCFDYILGHFEKFTGGVPTGALRVLRRAMPDYLARRPVRFGTGLLVALQRVSRDADFQTPGARIQDLESSLTPG